MADRLTLATPAAMASVSAARVAPRLLPSANAAANKLSFRSHLGLKSLGSSRLVSPLFLAQKSALQLLPSSRIGYSTASSPKCFASDPEQLKVAREDIKELLKTKFCHPILVRLGWHDAGTYNKNIEEWPQRGGANGSLRFEVELKHGANAGLVNAIKLLQPIKDKYSTITYADLFQLASATAIEEAGGPKIPMKYGRVDVSGPEQCPEEGRLPDAGPPSPAAHLRDVFYRMGLNDKEIVALSGAHTLGRSRPDRSGWGKPETKYTKDGPGAPGGQSWTVQWLKFDNSYFKDIKQRRDEDLLVLPTDAVLFEDPSFKEYAEKYAVDQDAFFRDYAEAHAKLSNLGAKFDPPEPLLEDLLVEVHCLVHNGIAPHCAKNTAAEALCYSVTQFPRHFLDMGCSGSKAEDLPLVTRCRQRRELILAAARHRYDLAAAHVSYFRSLKHVGDALRKFVDEELITTSASSCSSVYSPSLIFPPASTTKSKNAGEPLNLHDDEDEEHESHLHLSDSSSDDDGDPEGDYEYQHHAHDSDDTRHDQHHSHRPEKGFDIRVKDEESPLPTYGTGDGSINGRYVYPFYLLSPRSYEEPYMDPGNLQGMWPPWYYSNSSNVNYMRKSAQAIKTVVQEPPAQPAYGSPGSSDVRELEGIPDLEEESGNEAYKEVLKGKRTSSGESTRGSRAVPVHKSSGSSSTSVPLPKRKGSSRSVQLRKSESSSRAVPSSSSEESGKPSILSSPPESNGKSLDDQSAKGMANSITLTDEKSSQQTLAWKSVDEGSVKEKAAIFEVEGTSKQNAHRSPLSSVTVLSPHARRDLREVVAEIRDDFEIASSYGKEVAMMLEDEERLSVVYEKQCKRLNILDEEGAEPRKIDATQASIRRLRTKLDVRVKAINIISSRIHKLRDEELQPKIAALIYGLIRMWKAMLKCHRKQFQAIMECKMRRLKVSTGFPADSSSRAASELEKELCACCHHLKDWISFQRSYVESLNGWLLHCLQSEPEETPDGPVPCSPGQLGAPPIFIVCNDWHQAMEAISEGRVVNALNAFAASLHQLRKKQDEGRQRLKPEYLSKDHEKLLRTRPVERGEMEQKQDAMSVSAGLSAVPSDRGVSRLDDQKLSLESLKLRLAEERIEHKDAIKLVGDAAASSLQGGLVPIFKALENFTSEAVEAHEHIRLQHSLQSL
ncbi:UNVERIFIED_CONTAM: L-ascorbate peroxidase S, chloroplastic/mitochondrial [Sesamum angustifolium]|uniref:L-ascorbate peroxidase S, chloroplastic/mitochondrial n=1 Tax=Sesamum angustifolium TaxID=2727405 RepID=A0AAW2LW24_9LAMI